MTVRSLRTMVSLSRKPGDAALLGGILKRDFGTYWNC
jgi:hypothetical protein